jgi:hypothetical protein
MPSNGPLLPDERPIHDANSTDRPVRDSMEVVFTRDHELIRRWAAARKAEPATGEATRSGPARPNVVNDGGAGIRFNFPGAAMFRPISWDEWLANFDRHECAFVYDNDSSTPLSCRYRIVKADEWTDFLS